MSMSAAQPGRQAVAQALEEAVEPVSAAALAERFSVSRQIIVGDVALLRAGTDILATPEYLLGGRGGGVEHTVACVHASGGDGAGAQRTMVDAGARWWT